MQKVVIIVGPPEGTQGSVTAHTVHPKPKSSGVNAVAITILEQPSVLMERIVATSLIGIRNAILTANSLVFRQLVDRSSVRPDSFRIETYFWYYILRRIVQER